jgi:hypothetical protein
MNLEVQNRDRTAGGYGHPRFYIVDTDQQPPNFYTVGVTCMADVTQTRVSVTRDGDALYEEYYEGWIPRDGCEQMALDGLTHYLTEVGAVTEE